MLIFLLYVADSFEGFCVSERCVFPSGGYGRAYHMACTTSLHPVSTKRGQFIVLGPKYLWLDVQCFLFHTFCLSFPSIYFSSFISEYLCSCFSSTRSHIPTLFLSLSSDRCVVVFITHFIMRDSINVDYLILSPDHFS